ncbi:MAG: NYN domain-containing protein [Candidatus Portnoybacteria bacterium]|nr:NYN domain-containing protein [Candidatus Portnoybacteria bacterium]
MRKKSDGEKQVIVFIDAANIIYGCRRVGWKMDFEKLIRYMKTRLKADRILYYAGLDSENKKQLLFYEALQRFGYELRLVPVKRFKDGLRKGDVDARLTFEAMKYLNEYDEGIFLTGDGDYYWLLEYLLQNGKKTRLIAHRESTAKELRQLFGGTFTDISRLKKLLEFRKKTKKRQTP